ncbi:ShlB/FhaC/HecB family hemolysin secretion/activation protein [Paraburkholderia sp. J76]|uniref:ShlB/FhaC/HecB family hemolysin secretion/activation protein n=1 Tax=Paraburkholderia sp. J76 TaxID=2805439 RepID=UPI002ABE23B0|nr:ShlB/FhaC/HecB family hemolysin secretion/activation protein [Paraburkholderia sp. J76]
MKPLHAARVPALAMTLICAATLAAFTPAGTSAQTTAPFTSLVELAQHVPPPSTLAPGRDQLPGTDGVREPQNAVQGTLKGETVEPAVVSPVEANRQASQDSAVSFTVRRVTVTGMTRYGVGTFRPLLETIENRPVTLADVNAVAQQITARYRADGYLLVRTLVPAQSLENGELVIEVVEGKLNRVDVQGHESRAMHGYAEKLMQEQPLSAETLERNLMLMNDLPGNQVRATLVPSKNEAGTDAVLNNEFRRWDGFFGLDNRSSRYYGPWQWYAGVGLNDPTGLGDRLSVRGGMSLDGRKMSFYEGQYEVPLGSDGVALSLLAQHSDGHADLPSYLNANSQGDNFAARLTWAPVRSREQTVKFTGALTAFNGRSVYLDDPSLPPSSNDRIRALRVGASYDFTDPRGGRNLIKGEVSQGLDGLGASTGNTINPSRQGGRTDFTKLQLDAQRMQDLSWITPGLGLYLAATGQTSFGKPLLAPEQFGVGGNFFGRGYDPSEIAGDSGVAGKVELQYNRVHKIGDRAVPAQYYAYWDIGKVWNIQPYYVRSQSLASAGAGVHLNVAKRTYVSPEIAFPLTRPVAAEVVNGHSGRSPRFYLNFLKQF